MLTFLELTPRFKKLKRRASLEFCIHLDMNQIGIVCFTKLSLGILKFSFFKAFFTPGTKGAKIAEVFPGHRHNGRLLKAGDWALIYDFGRKPPFRYPDFQTVGMRMTPPPPLPSENQATLQAHRTAIG